MCVTGRSIQITHSLTLDGVSGVLGVAFAATPAPEAGVAEEATEGLVGVDTTGVDAAVRSVVDGTGAVTAGLVV